MLMWVMNKLGWIAIRVIVTLLCIFTIKNVAHQQGYFISYETLIVSAACLIVGIRFWIPKCNHCAWTEISEESGHEQSVHVKEQHGVSYTPSTKKD